MYAAFLSTIISEYASDFCITLVNLCSYIEPLDIKKMDHCLNSVACYENLINVLFVYYNWGNLRVFIVFFDAVVYRKY